MIGFLQRTLIAMAALMGVMGLIAGNALASNKAEGHGGNSIVCGGVHSKAQLMFYVKGGPDSCGHTDIAVVWAKMGITPEIAQKMRLGTVCSSGKFTSSGRRHSPRPSADRPIVVNGHVIYLRPLAVWGKGCYAAWVGHTEDGQTVAVLAGCGNSETTHVSPKPPVSKPPVVTTPSGSCNVTIINSPGANGEACVTYWVVCGNVVKGPFSTAAEAQLAVGGNCNTVTSCNCGSQPPPPSGCGSNCPPPTCQQTNTCQPPPPTCQQTNTCPPPVQHSCSLAVQSPKSGSSTVNASVTTDVSPSSVNINWGDGSSSGGSSASHTYPTPAPSSHAGDGVNYTVSATANFGNQSVSCGSQTVFIPSPPPNGNGGPPPPPPPSPDAIEL